MNHVRETPRLWISDALMGEMEAARGVLDGVYGFDDSRRAALLAGYRGAEPFDTVYGFLRGLGAGEGLAEKYTRSIGSGSCVCVPTCEFSEELDYAVMIGRRRQMSGKRLVRTLGEEVAHGEHNRLHGTERFTPHADEFFGRLGYLEVEDVMRRRDGLDGTRHVSVFNIFQPRDSDWKSSLSRWSIGYQVADYAFPRLGRNKKAELFHADDEREMWRMLNSEAGTPELAFRYHPIACLGHFTLEEAGTFVGQILEKMGLDAKVRLDENK